MRENVSANDDHRQRRAGQSDKAELARQDYKARRQYTKSSALLPDEN